MEIKIRLKKGKEFPVRRFHPWVFSGAVKSVEGTPEDGDVVVVTDHAGEVLGSGHFHHGSIAVRLLAFDHADVTQLPFWTEKLRKAWEMRQLLGLGSPKTNAYRLVHGEGDGLSGLIVDLYADVAVLQCHSIGMHRQRQMIADALIAVAGGALSAVYDKSRESLPKRYAEQVENRFLVGNMESEEGMVVRENDVSFKVDFVRGQKTGFFLDQRENRALLSRYCQGKTLLNTFCYTGGFSAYALRSGASLVHSVDVSGNAVALAAENAALNNPEDIVHEAFAEDVLRFLQRETFLYDVVVVDPPAYAKTMDKRHNAVQGYKRLNVAAMERVSPGGLLFTFSCSQVVDRELFYNTIVSAALECGRTARVLHHLSQGPDHPVSLFHPEGSYLKGLAVHLE